MEPESERYVRCEHDICSKKPIYNFPDEKTPKFCEEHKSTGMVNIMIESILDAAGLCQSKPEEAKKIQCAVDGCRAEAIKPKDNVETSKYCSTHTPLRSLESYLCKHPACFKPAVFDEFEQSFTKYCFTHRRKNSTVCAEPTCNAIPLFNIEGSIVGKFCGIHRREGMIDVKNKILRCAHPDCMKQPFYNYEGSLGGKFCTGHKLEGMVNVKSRRCEFENCKTRPVFNMPGEIMGRFCSKHKSPEMVDVKNRHCIEMHCRRWPYFNYPGNKTAEYCADHFKDGMVDCRGKRNGVAVFKKRWEVEPIATTAPASVAISASEMLPGIVGPVPSLAKSSTSSGSVSSGPLLCHPVSRDSTPPSHLKVYRDELNP